MATAPVPLPDAAYLAERIGADHPLVRAARALWDGPHHDTQAGERALEEWRQRWAHLANVDPDHTSYASVREAIAAATFVRVASERRRAGLRAIADVVDAHVPTRRRDPRDGSGPRQRRSA